MDVQVIAIGVGLIVSLVFTEAFGLAAGGMIVPGYFALSLNRPGCIVLTLLAALVTFAIVRGVSHVALVYGRRRIALMLITGFVVGAALRAAAACLQGPEAEAAHAQAWLTVVGFIIPGLIALWIDRQGLVETLAPLMTLSVGVRLVLVALAMEPML